MRSKRGTPPRQPRPSYRCRSHTLAGTVTSQPAYIGHVHGNRADAEPSERVRTLTQIDSGLSLLILIITRHRVQLSNTSTVEVVAASLRYRRCEFTSVLVRYACKLRVETENCRNARPRFVGYQYLAWDGTATWYLSHEKQGVFMRSR